TEGPKTAERSLDAWDEHGPLGTAHKLKFVAGRPARFRQIAAMLPSVMHHQPEAHALRLLVAAKELGFDEIRRRNRAAWAEIWKGRVRLVGAEPKWQALADAAFYYLNASVHGASPASTSIYGLAT